MNLSNGNIYFAYGSNMLPEQMEFRCPRSKPIGVAVLKGWRFVMNDRGVSTIAKSEPDEVIGVLWDITDEHESILDGYEGVADDWYYKHYVDVELRTGETVEALVYIDPNDEPGPPREGYLEKILGGANHFGLPGGYVKMLELSGEFSGG